MKKHSCTPINPKKIFMLWPKKNSYQEFDNEKKFLRQENSPPPPPHNFSNGPFLIMHKYLVGGHECAFQSCSLSTRWGVEFVRHWRNEMRPAIVSGIVTGHVPISYWPFFFSLSLVTVSGVLQSGELALCSFYLSSLPFSFRDASLVRVQNEVNKFYSPARQLLFWKFLSLKVPQSLRLFDDISH